MYTYNTNAPPRKKQTNKSTPPHFAKKRTSPTKKGAFHGKSSAHRCGVGG